MEGVRAQEESKANVTQQDQWQRVGPGRRSMKERVREVAESVNERENEIERPGKESNQEAGKRLANEKRSIPFAIVGDSMIKNIDRIVRLGERSRCICRKGAKVDTIVKEAEEAALGMNDGMIVIQGGGNGLTDRDEDESVKMVLDGVRNIKDRDKRMRVSVVSVLPRPGMEKDNQYEKMRKNINKKLHVAIMEMNLKARVDPGNNGVSFMDMDPVITPDMYVHDGVHLNERGTEKLAQHIIRWLNGSSLMLAMKRLRSVNGKESVKK